MIVKCLSLRQPWAELILQGKKTIETRVWNTKYRGEFYIHAAYNYDKEGMRRLGFTGLPHGCVIGKAVLSDVKQYRSDEEFLADAGKHLVDEKTLERIGWAGRKKYGFILEKPERVKQLPMKGSLGFFKIMV